MLYLLVGNYGTGNLGDEALKEYFLTTFPQVQWQGVSVSPGKGELQRLPGGIRSLFNLRWLRTIQALCCSDGLVFGGGSLLTDAESVYACLLWWWHAFVARVFHKRILLAFQGIGPFRTGVGETLARSVVGWADFISVRDEESLARVSNWNLNKEVVLSFDPVFSLIEGKRIEKRSQNVLIVIPRKGLTQAFEGRLEKLVKRAGALRSCVSWDAVRIVSLQPEDPEEKRTCCALRRLMEHIPCSVSCVRSLSELREALSDGSFILSQRYHGTLAGFALGIPTESVSQSSGDKFEGLETLLGQPEARTHGWKRLREGEESLRRALRST